jgi:hypothetical protein
MSQIQIQISTCQWLITYKTNILTTSFLTISKHMKPTYGNMEDQQLAWLWRWVKGGPKVICHIRLTCKFSTDGIITLGVCMCYCVLPGVSAIVWLPEQRYEDELKFCVFHWSRTTRFLIVTYSFFVSGSARWYILPTVLAYSQQDYFQQTHPLELSLLTEYSS